MLKIANHTHYHKQLARRLVEQARHIAPEADMTLGINDSEISLCSVINGQQACYTHSFTQPRLVKRAKQKNQALLKACNNKKQTLHRVLDLTAGWGKDSFILACHGQQVNMIEQNNLIAACLNYLVEIAGLEQPDDCYQRMEVFHRNSLQYLQQNPTINADCVYLDPMFPAHKSSAKPSKDLQLLQMLTDNQDMELLFAKALECARHRVVVKRPLHAPTLNDIKPDIVYREKTIRFDVYLGK